MTPHAKRLLTAARNEARIEVLSELYPRRRWVQTNTIGGFDECLGYRIHPDDAQLQYGPIATELRKMVVSQSDL